MHRKEGVSQLAELGVMRATRCVLRLVLIQLSLQPLALFGKFTVLLDDPHHGGVRSLCLLHLRRTIVERGESWKRRVKLAESDKQVNRNGLVACLLAG